MSDFSERLKYARGDRSQRCIALAVGIKQQAYARYESEKATPGIDILAKLCRELGVSSDWLLGLTNAGAPSRHATEPGGRKRTA